MPYDPVNPVVDPVDINTGTDGYLVRTNDRNPTLRVIKKRGETETTLTRKLRRYNYSGFENCWTFTAIYWDYTCDEYDFYYSSDDCPEYLAFTLLKTENFQREFPSYGENSGYYLIIDRVLNYISSIQYPNGMQFYTKDNRAVGTTGDDDIYGLKTFEDNVTFYGEVKPGSDNRVDLGNASYRWKQLYAGTTTISTSDERLKQQITPIPENVLQTWGKVNFYQFKYNDAVEEKGVNARLHTGMIAQRIKSVFEENDLDPFVYGLLCYDEWEEEVPVYDEDGSIIRIDIESCNRYSLRYEECLCMEAAYQRYRADKLEARLKRIEEALNINE